MKVTTKRINEVRVIAHYDPDEMPEIHVYDGVPVRVRSIVAIFDCEPGEPDRFRSASCRAFKIKKDGGTSKVSAYVSSGNADLNALAKGLYPR